MLSMILFFFSFILFETSLASCKYKFIHNASELIEFSNEVNNGTTYYVYTVYLVNDIDFSGISQQYIPINNFRGTFDGQGYTVSSLTIDFSSLQVVGLFGYSYGATIKNTVIDSSCSVSSYYKASYTDSTLVGGIIGYSCTKKEPFILENNVNMAKVTFKSSSSSSKGNIWIGGIAGCIDVLSNNNEGKVINCVNYGAIYASGSRSSSSVYMGGIIGEIYVTAKRYTGHIYIVLITEL